MLVQSNYEKTEKIIIEFEKKIFNLLCSLSGNIEEAKDLTQETFIRAYKKIHSFREESEIFTWLHRIAINCWKNKVRYNRRRGIFQTVSLDNPPDECLPIISQVKDEKATSPEQDAIQSEMQKRIQIEIHSLLPKYKIPITLRIKNMTYEEIAKVLKCRVGTAKSLVSRAKEKLKEKIIPYL